MKAKLVIEMPDNCDSCRFFCQYEDGQYACCALYFLKYFTDDEVDCTGTKRVDWCPLEPVKEKKYSDPNLCSECGTPYIGKFG